MAIQDTNLQSNRQHAVPQNIMDVEFKIIGDLTMRQFSYLMILGLLAYFNMQFMVGIFKWPLTLVFGLLGLGLAFVPVQDRGLDVWLVNFIKSVYSPTQRVWRKSLAVPSAFLYDNLAVVKQELITLAPTSSRRKLEEYLDYSNKVMPRDPLDMRVDEYVLKVRQAYAGYNTAPVSVDASVTTSEPVNEYDNYVPKSVSEFISKEEPKVPTQEVATNSGVKSNSISSLSAGVGAGFTNLVSKIESNVGAAIKDISSLAKDVSNNSNFRQESKEAIVSPVQKESNIKSTPNISTLSNNSTATASGQNVITGINKNVQNREVTNDVKVETLSSRPVTPIIKSALAPKGSVPGRRLSSSVSSTPVFSSITPDRHSGRKFTSFLPEQGELVLPIRGERVLKTSDQLKLEENIEEKTVQLQQLLSQIRQSNGSISDSSANLSNSVKPSNAFSTDKGTVKLNPLDTSSNTSNSSNSRVNTGSPINITNSVKESSSPVQNSISDSKANAISQVSQEALGILVKQRENIMNELSSLRASNGTTSNEKILSLQKQLQQVNTQYQQVKKELQDIENMAKVQGSVSQLTTSSKSISSSIALNTSSNFSKPNVLWGFVKSEDNKPVTDTVVIVKNFRGEPVRAVKTNALGQFNLTTPVNNGKYIVEVSNSNKLGLTFDTLSIEASGNVIPSMEFIGHKG